MRASTKDRECYHPTIDIDGRFVGGIRDSAGRLRLIEDEVDFTGKRVLDLGCSGGFFTFSVARKAKSVTAVDADRHMIEKNREISKKLGHRNIEFICNRIEPQFIKSLPHYDVVLFLSVFHHMITGSPIYDWNSSNENNCALSTLNVIRQLGSVYIFEIGRPGEPGGWSENLKLLIAEPEKWILDNVFGSDYKSVKALRGVGYQKWPFRSFPQLAGIGYRSAIGRKIIEMMGVHLSDFRDIYIGRKG